jgi:hypothetical protein
MGHLSNFSDEVAEFKLRSDEFNRKLASQKRGLTAPLADATWV